MKDLRTKRDMAILLITHNMGLVAEMCDRVVVMHMGKIVEMASVEDIFAQPRHPYTQGLLRSMPTLSSPLKEPLPTLDWHPTAEQSGGALKEIGNGHFVSAWVS
jgi:ABC-type dipeptide/oligopeptide/nickel transport system ATPase component